MESLIYELCPGRLKLELSRVIEIDRHECHTIVFVWKGSHECDQAPSSSLFICTVSQLGISLGFHSRFELSPCVSCLEWNILSVHVPQLSGGASS